MDIVIQSDATNQLNCLKYKYELLWKINGQRNTVSTLSAVFYPQLNLNKVTQKITMAAIDFA